MLSRLETLKRKIQSAKEISSLRNEILEEFEKIIIFVKGHLEKDVQTLGKDLEELQKSSVSDPRTLQIIGHLVTDFSELHKDLETEI